MSPVEKLHEQIRACTVCTKHLPLGANPVLRVNAKARILLVGQAPGTRVHRTGIPWNDPSGEKLRDWLAVDRDTFYDTEKFAIVPMGFCYPGKGPSGDNPPRPECAPLWHIKVRSLLPKLELTVLIGSYAIRYYLPGPGNLSLRDRVRRANFEKDLFLPLVHPSPRNKLWIKQNPWFEHQAVPGLRSRIHRLLRS